MWSSVVIQKDGSWSIDQLLIVRLKYGSFLLGFRRERPALSCVFFWALTKSCRTKVSRFSTLPISARWHKVISLETPIFSRNSCSQGPVSTGAFNASLSTWESLVGHIAHSKGWKRSRELFKPTTAYELRNDFSTKHTVKISNCVSRCGFGRIHIFVDKKAVQ